MYNTSRENLKSVRAASYPDHIVNGDFSANTSLFPTCPNAWWQVSRYDKKIYADATHTWTTISNFDTAAFGWDSTEITDNTLTHPSLANAVEIQKDISGNYYAEIVNQHKDKAIYQDVQVKPNALYKIYVDHTSIYSSHADQMQVIISDSAGSAPIDMWRLAPNKTGAQGDPGFVGSIITTKTSGGGIRDHNDNWCTYYGFYKNNSSSPELVRFSFSSYAAPAATTGNLVDNIFFEQAYPLFYDANGGDQSKMPVPEEKDDYTGYEIEGTKVLLTNTVPTRIGYSFIGWSETRFADINNKASFDTVQQYLIKDIIMEAPSKTVYAVWAKNPTITYIDPLDDNNVIYSIEIPFGSAATGLPDNILPPVHEHYDYTGYSVPLPSAVYEDTTIPLAYKGSPVKLRVQLVNAKNNSPLRWAGFDISVDAENNTTSISLETDGSGTAAFDGIAFGSYSAALTERPEGFLYPDYVTDFSADPALADAEGYITVEIPVMPQLSRRTTEYESSNDFDFYYPAWIAVYGDDELVMGRGTGYPYPQYDGKKLNENYIWLDVERRELGTRPFWAVKEKIKSVKVIDRIRPLNPQMWFLHFSACTSYDITKLDMSACTSLRMFFGGNHAAEEIDVTGWDTSNVTTMSACFSSWGTNPDGTGFIFKDNKLKRIKGLETWNVSKVTDFNDAFSRNWNLEDIGNIGNWDMSSANTVHHMFVEDRVLKTNVSGFRKTINMNIPGLNGLCIDGNVYMCMLGIKEMKAPGVVF